MEFFGFYVAIFFEIVLAGFVIWGFAKHEKDFMRFEQKMFQAMKTNMKVTRRMVNARVRAKKESKVAFNRAVNRQYRQIKADISREEAESNG